MQMAALVTVLMIAWLRTAAAQTTHEDPKTLEGWAWQRIRNDEIADFNERCQKELKPHDKTGWDDPCRQVPAKFLVDILTLPKLRDQLARQRLRLRGARIDGTMDLTDTDITAEVRIDASRIDGDLILASSHWKHSLAVEGSNIAGRVSASGMRTESDILLRSAAAIEGEVDLTAAKVGGTVDLSGAKFAQTVHGAGLRVEGSLFMHDHATFGEQVNLRAAKIGGTVDMSGSEFFGTVRGTRLTVEGSRFMHGHARFGELVSLLGAKIGGILALDDAVAARIDLTGAAAQELVLGGLGWWCLGREAPTGLAKGAALPAHWPLGSSAWQSARCDVKFDQPSPQLILRNAHFANFQDSADAWPPLMDLEGFHYERLGGIEGGGRNDMRKRSPEEWIEWLERDPTFSTQP
jgi:cytoskeletal protein CcmA (bactofilin family)